MNYQAGESTRLKRQRADQAIQLALQSRWEEAAAINRSIISVFPSDVDAYNRLGKALMEMGESEEARRAYEKTLALEPGNSIARKNLERLDARKSIAAVRVESPKSIDPALFIAQTGSTGIANLKAIVPETLAGLTAGDTLNLRIEGHTVAVETVGDQLGEIEPKLGLRLARLIEGGNRYVAAVASLSNGGVRIIIREIYQHPSQHGKPSFPVSGGDTFRSYVKERLVRHDLDEEEPSEEREEEGEDWEHETVATEGDIALQDYQEATEREADEEEFEE